MAAMTTAYATAQARIESYEKARIVGTNTRSRAKKNFRSWPHASPDSTAMARAGFVFAPTNASTDRAECFICGLALDQWDDGDNPIQEHVRNSPDCAWARLAGRLAHHWALEHNAASLAGTEHDPMSQRNLNDRLETLTRWPHESKRGWRPKAAAIAQAGLYHDPQEIDDDAATCSLCGVMLNGWERTDDPREEHHKRQPGCLFFAEPLVVISSQGSEEKLVADPKIETEAASDSLTRSYNSEESVVEEEEQAAGRSLPAATVLANSSTRGDEEQDALELKEAAGLLIETTVSSSTNKVTTRPDSLLPEFSHLLASRSIGHDSTSEDRNDDEFSTARDSSFADEVSALRPTPLPSQAISFSIDSRSDFDGASEISETVVHANDDELVPDITPPAADSSEDLVLAEDIPAQSADSSHEPILVIPRMSHSHSVVDLVNSTLDAIDSVSLGKRSSEDELLPDSKRHSSSSSDESTLEPHAATKSSSDIQDTPDTARRYHETAEPTSLPVLQPLSEPEQRRSARSSFLSSWIHSTPSFLRKAPLLGLALPSPLARAEKVQPTQVPIASSVVQEEPAELLNSSSSFESLDVAGDCEPAPETSPATLSLPSLESLVEGVPGIADVTLKDLAAQGSTMKPKEWLELVAGRVTQAMQANTEHMVNELEKHRRAAITAVLTSACPSEAN